MVLVLFQVILVLFQVVSYLFSQKVLAPSKFFLLRGNHELRSVQENFNFKRECCEKFGEQVGLKVWDTINECFDVMPVAAVIDSKVSTEYCYLSFAILWLWMIYAVDVMLQV